MRARVLPVRLVSETTTPAEIEPSAAAITRGLAEIVELASTPTAPTLVSFVAVAPSA